MSGIRLGPLVVVAIIAVLLFLIPSASGLLVDFWWFREIGYETVFTQRLFTRTLLFAVVALLAWLVVHFNLHFAQRGVVPSAIQFEGPEGTNTVDIASGIKRISRPAAIILALLFGLGASANWDTVLQWVHRTPFGTTDPVFARDIGWYVFTLPMLSMVLGILSGLVTLSLVALLPVYFLRGDIVVQPNRLRIEPSAGMHLGVLLAAWFLLAGGQLWFVDTARLLFSGTGPLVGASYTDLNASLPALRISAVVAVLAAVAVLIGATRRQLGWYGFLAVGVYALVGIVGRGAAPALMQKFVVSPTELTRETPYLERHITATRLAWGLDNVEERELVGETRLTMNTIRANDPTIENIRLWDRAPLLRTFNQLQAIRTYYDFTQVDDDRYWIDGKYRQVLLSTRELNTASLPTRNFINENLTYTHGMGLTLSPVNEVTTEGLPVLFVKDLPPASTGSLKIERPQIYYGELTQDYVITGTRQREFDYPSGDANVYTTYNGTGGVAIGGVLRRALFSLHFGTSKILLSGDMTGDSKILYHRNINTRVARALPFLQFDRDPYIVIADDGTLKWIQDAYTMTNAYPYAFRTGGGTSYMRNSVKIVIDAYDGSLTAYIAEPNDPLIQTWTKVFPNVFVPIEQMPADLRTHVRYPDDLFRVQTSLYATYHMGNPTDFYNREDQWQIPVVSRPDEAVPFMRHIIMRLPDEAEAEFIYMAPFTPRGKDNLAAWMVARNDGENYGKLRVYRFPRQSLVFGPRQVENRINQDTEIARQISLWDQRGSQVIRGDLLVIPIEAALLYVQPLYLQAEGGRIPELKRVIVAYENQVVMRETLDGALAALFGGDSGEPMPVLAEGEEVAPVLDATIESLIGEARRRYQSAVDAQREGDWARYGSELQELGAALERLAAARGSSSD